MCVHRRRSVSQILKLDCQKQFLSLSLSLSLSHSLSLSLSLPPLFFCFFSRLETISSCCFFFVLFLIMSTACSSSGDDRLSGWHFTDRLQDEVCSSLQTDFLLLLLLLFLIPFIALTLLPNLTCSIRIKRDVVRSGMRGMQTFGYAWNADIRVCVRGLEVSGNRKQTRWKRCRQHSTGRRRAGGHGTHAVSSNLHNYRCRRGIFAQVHNDNFSGEAKNCPFFPTKIVSILIICSWYMLRLIRWVWLFCFYYIFYFFIIKKSYAIFGLRNFLFDTD